MSDLTDFLLLAILAPTAVGLILFFVGFFIGRRQERRDRWRQDDKTRIYETLYGEVRKLVLSEDSAKRGFVLNTPDTQVLDDIVSHGLLVPPRHHALREDVERLSELASVYRQRSFDDNVAANKAFAIEGDKAHLDSVKSDTALFNAVVGLSQEAFIKRYQEILQGKPEARPDESASGEKMFHAITIAVEVARELLREATNDLLSHGKAMKRGLESAIRRGKYRRSRNRT